MILLFVHGWSVTDTVTYGLLPEVLADRAAGYGIELDIKHIWLGRYISFHDEVTLSDVARAFNTALQEQIPDGDAIKPFSCITHSTGGPVVREWLNLFYGASNLKQSPLEHLIMLAPANHGSALAALGKQKVGRIKAWFSGTEPGQRILDWLSLGSLQQFELAKAYLEYTPADSGFYPFVLTGQTIDKKFYDFVNSYLGEKGSDGVVRVAGANMNYSMIRLAETDETVTVKHGPEEISPHVLEVAESIRHPEMVPLGVIPQASHSGQDKGIMRSVVSLKSSKLQIDEIFNCLKVKSKNDYIRRAQELEQLTQRAQKNGHRYMMIVFMVNDDQGEPVTDYDLVLLGENHSPEGLSRGFFVDRQQNAAHPNHLVYYIDVNEVSKKGLTGFRILPRPTDGFTYYHRAVEFHFDDFDTDVYLKPNETFYVEVELRRCIDKEVFRLDAATEFKLHKQKKFFVLEKETRHDFKKVKAKDSGEDGK